jgi:tetratricopeptide (TPR) repeat protein
MRAHWLGDHDLYAAFADAAVQQHDLDALLKYAPLAEETATRYGHKLYLVIAHRAWGVAHRLEGKYEEAEARLQQALDLFTEMDTRWQIGRTLYELGVLAQARTDTSAAREYFSRGLAQFEALGATPDAARTRQALEAIG